MKLVIVESPAKSNTISHYLGKDYMVMASKGHIKDLVAGKGHFWLGVDVDDNFRALYEVSKDKEKVVKELIKAKEMSDEVLLATDPDREGEAIAYSLANVLDLDVKKTKRLEFHEITKEAILNAIEHPRLIDMNLVQSQEARRIIDRIMGFKLSSLLQSKISSKSAGRVQSVALKLICDHEEEILAFVPKKFYKLNVKALIESKEYDLALYKYKGERLDTFSEESVANEALKSLSDKVKLSDIEEKERMIPSKEPFRTSTLQQVAFQYLKFSTKLTQRIAQELYEGVQIGNEVVGLITYMRTDSTRLSSSFVSQVKDLIISQYGENYYKGEKQVKKVKGEQDAHEAIRPTSIHRTPEEVKPYLTNQQYRLYKLIFERTVSSLMSDKKVLTTTNYFESGDCEFKLVTSKTLFKGYDVFNIDTDEENNEVTLDVSSLDPFTLYDSFNIKSKEVEEDETKPPARYSEGKLVKMMEENGIGRPSTYSATINTLLERNYVESQKGILVPTDQGLLTSRVLNKYFPEIVNVTYTAKMEESLDLIQSGELKRNDVLNDFYYPFEEHFEEVKEKMYKEPLKVTGEKCPVCGNDLVIRNGKFGKFVSCSNYPSCKYIKKEEKEIKYVGRMCPDCGSPLIYRKNKKGSEFIGCSNFPKCTYIEDLNKPQEEERICPDCGAKLVLKRARLKGRTSYFYGCSNYPSCKHTEKV